MITTLLFDLDGTLLDNDLGVFLPDYFQLLAQAFPELDPQRLIAEVIKSSRATISSQDVARPLVQVFLQHLLAGLPGDPQNWVTRFLAFYHTEFPKLRGLTTPIPAARAVMDWAFANGYKVIIATTPIFPLIAIEERLRWGNIAGYPYTLITTIDNFHFAKPRAEYFAEILANVGSRPEETLMVGNDWPDDIVPAAALGIAQYWIAPMGSHAPSGRRPEQGVPPPSPRGIGELDEFLEWAVSAVPKLQPSARPNTALPHLLAGNLAALTSLLTNLTEAEWTRRSAEGDWSLTEIICHWRDVDREVNFPRLHTLIETHDPFLAAADTDPWAVARNYQVQSGPQALRDFINIRRGLYTFLAEQPHTIWRRPARHAIFGPTHLAEIVGWILDHDQLHLGQVRSTLKKIRAEG